MVGVIYVYVDTVFGCSWMFQQASLDTCCFECLIIKLYVCVLYFFVFAPVQRN